MTEIVGIMGMPVPPFPIHNATGTQQATDTNRYATNWSVVSVKSIPKTTDETVTIAIVWGRFARRALTARDRTAEDLFIERKLAADRP
jgi:hypothetical protein